MAAIFITQQKGIVNSQTFHKNIELPQESIFAKEVFVLSNDSLTFSASLPVDTVHVLDDSR